MDSEKRALLARIEKLEQAMGEVLDHINALPEPRQMDIISRRVKEWWEDEMEDNENPYHVVYGGIHKGWFIFENQVGPEFDNKEEAEAYLRDYLPQKNGSPEGAEVVG